MERENVSAKAEREKERRGQRRGGVGDVGPFPPLVLLREHKRWSSHHCQNSAELSKL